MRIAVLSRNSKLYSTGRLIEAAQQRGHEAEVIDPLKCDIVMDQGPAIYYNGKELTDIDAIIPRIGASITYYGTAVVRQFEMIKVTSAVSSLSITRSRDKLRSLQILSRAELKMPKTAFTNYSKKDDSSLLNHIGKAPVVVKLLEGTQGLGVVLAETKKAAESVIQAFEGLRARIILQEFIEEAGGADIRAFVVDGEVVGSMKRQGKEGEFRSNLHRGGKPEIIKLSRGERASAVKAAEAMGLAVAGVDMLQSNRGPLILEVNSSPGLEGIEKATQVDIAGKIIEYLVRKHEKSNKSKRKRKITA